jgi:hypothetical protein
MSTGRRMCVRLVAIARDAGTRRLGTANGVSTTLQSLHPTHAHMRSQSPADSFPPSLPPLLPQRTANLGFWKYVSASKVQYNTPSFWSTSKDAGLFGFKRCSSRWSTVVSSSMYQASSMMMMMVKWRRLRLACCVWVGVGLGRRD